MDKLISIIVPVYNAEENLDRCISSIIGQTYQNMELILINDGSTDYSGEICAAWMNKDSRIKYCYQDNSGVSEARNLGMKYATGSYIAFVDSDDYIETSFCEKMIEKLIESKADIIFCERKNYYSDGRMIATGDNSHKLLTVPSEEYEYYGYKERRSVWGAVYRVDVLKNLKFSKRLAVGEDALFLAHAIQKSKLLAYYDEPLYYYTIQNESAYFGKFTEQKNTEIAAWIQICDAIKNNGITKMSAVATCATVATTMLARYAGDPNFDRRYIGELISIYRKRLPQLLQYDRLKKRKVIKHIVFGCVPHIVIKYWESRNEKERRHCDII